MSCTVLAIPIAIAWLASSVIIPIATTVAVENAKKEGAKEENCEDIHIFTEKALLSNTFETPFNDIEVLIKTLEEHGVDITERSDCKVVGVCDKYILSFEKSDFEKPFYLTAKYDDEKLFTETLNDLNTEYSVNVQESTYLSLLEKLKENNLEIAEEEVLEDNSIVLTVNLE